MTSQTDTQLICATRLALGQLRTAPGRPLSATEQAARQAHAAALLAQLQARRTH